MEIPILFSTPMVQAILDGRKTMTRRVCKLDTANFDYDPKDKDYGPFLQDEYGDSIDVKALCSYGQPGDRLWVRETWMATEPHFGKGTEPKYYYRADQTPESEQCRKDFGIPWKPSIHMPKVAARIWLEVISVRVERLQEITYEDCLREGMWNYGTDVDTLAAFQELWQNLNAKRGYDWNVNPWVWVVEFERVSA